VTQIDVPTLVRIKPGALDRLGIYLARQHEKKIALLHSEGLVPALLEQARYSLEHNGIEVVFPKEVPEASFELAAEIFGQLPAQCGAVVGLGGGKALDMAKYLATLARKRFYAVPTSLSHDGFASPQASLTVKGKRRSLPCRMADAIVVDTEVCLHAPPILWSSGVGDLVSKVSAVHDWKLAFHAQGTVINDFAALLSDATVSQFVSRPQNDLEGQKLLATALMLNGVAMEVAGTSRPASGSEHLISHALDLVSEHPRLHGLQVGVATYVVTHLQKQGHERVAHVLKESGFWKYIFQNPWKRSEWQAAIDLAPSIKPDFYTILAERDCRAEIMAFLESDPMLKACFRNE
jgi:glycerol-1-phosphate dehydrogenase [NAD(P)+]